jgi:hypothetical protein
MELIDAGFEDSLTVQFRRRLLILCLAGLSSTARELQHTEIIVLQEWLGLIYKDSRQAALRHLPATLSAISRFQIEKRGPGG